MSLYRVCFALDCALAGANLGAALGEALQHRDTVMAFNLAVALYCAGTATWFWRRVLERYA